MNARLCSLLLCFLVLGCTPVNTPPVDVDLNEINSEIATDELASNNDMLNSYPVNKRDVHYAPVLAYPVLVAASTQPAQKNRIEQCDLKTLSPTDVKTTVYQYLHHVSQYETDLARIQVIDWISESQSFLVTHSPEEYSSSGPSQYISLLRLEDMKVTSLASQRWPHAQPVYNPNNGSLYYLSNKDDVYMVNSLSIFSEQPDKVNSSLIINTQQFAVLPNDQIVTYDSIETRLLSQKLTLTDDENDENNETHLTSNKFNSQLPLSHSTDGEWPKLLSSSTGNIAAYSPPTQFLIYHENAFCTLDMVNVINSTLAARVLEARWSPNGQKLALIVDREPYGFIGEATSHLVIIDLQDQTILDVSGEATVAWDFLHSIAWSPDSSQLGFFSSAGNRKALNSDTEFPVYLFGQLNHKSNEISVEPTENALFVGKDMVWLPDNQVAYSCFEGIVGKDAQLCLRDMSHD